MTHGDYWPEQKVFDELKLALSSGKPSKKLLTYLDNFAHDKLTTGTPDRPPTYLKQRVGLLIIVSQQLQEQGLRQVVKQTDTPRIRPVPNFWSVLSAMCYVSHDIELTKNIGYDYMATEAGIKPTQKVGYAEILIDGNMAQKLTNTLQQDTAPIKLQARIIMPNRHVLIEADGSTYQISKQELRTDLAPYSLMKQLTDHPTITVTLAAANQKLAGCEDIKSLSEIIRQVGFNEVRKNLFFKVCTANKVQLKKDLYLNKNDLDLLEN